MKIKSSFHYLSLLLLCAHSFNASASPSYPWAVVGAGPAGITAVAVLMEFGVDTKDIVWIDPEFKVGRLGKYYGNVPSNQKACRAVAFLECGPIFPRINPPSLQILKAYDQDLEMPLQMLVDPLQEISDYLVERIAVYRDVVTAFTYENEMWRVTMGNNECFAQKVILAQGSYPKRFEFTDIQEIDSDLALDENKLKTMITADDTVLVVGSSHSAMLILKYLSDMPVKKVINIYNKLPIYGMYNGGLEGITAWWTKNVLEVNPPANLQRVKYDPATIEQYKNQCNKVIYAFGYDRHEIMVNGKTGMSFDNATGIVQRRMYGLGIAFPEKYTCEGGNSFNLIGVNAFMERAQELMPLWLKD